MKNTEKEHTEKVVKMLTVAVHEFNNLNMEQLQYANLLFKKIFLERDIERLLNKTKNNKKDSKTMNSIDI